MDWKKQTHHILSAGTHTLKWEYSKDASGSAGQDTAWINELRIATYPEASFDFQDGTMQGFDTAGNADWFNGDGVLISGDIIDNQTSYLTRTVYFAEETTISFDWKVSSEADYDYLEFYILVI